MDEYDCPMWRFLAALDYRARAGAKRACFLKGAVQPNNLESRPRQAVPRFLRRRQETGACGARPGRRIVEFSAFALGDLREYQPGARLEDAVNLAVERAFVGDVHRDIHRVGAVEGGIGEWHCQGVADLERDPVLEIEQARKVAGNVAEFGRQIDSGDPATEVACEVARRPADATADVENGSLALFSVFLL